MWSIVNRDGNMGLFFDWAEIAPGILVLADPMQVGSNVCFVNDLGRPIPTSQALLQLNQAVYDLKWQRVVCEQVREWRRMDMTCHDGIPAKGERPHRMPRLPGAGMRPTALVRC